jgi:hypothetical protein
VGTPAIGARVGLSSFGYCHDADLSDYNKAKEARTCCQQASIVERANGGCQPQRSKGSGSV